MKDRYRSILIVVLVIMWNASAAQVIPAERTTAWSNAGFIYDIPEPTLELDIMDFGAVADGSASVNAAWNAAVDAASGQMAAISFPQGEFLFTSGIVVPDSVIVRGAGSELTTFIFNLGGIGHCIGFIGQELVAQYPLATNAPRGSNTINTTVPFPFQTGDLLRFYRDDEDLVVSPWAVGTTGQLVHIEFAGNATIFLASPLRANYDAGSSYVRQIDPCMFSGIECLKIIREDETAEQWSNIWLNKASHCWVRGVESEMANFSHMEVYESTNCEITGNYLHHGFSYGSGGKAYGVNMTNTSGEMLVQDNIFEHLRHSMIVQIGANGNVLAYNYSTDPFWQQPPLPANAAGDLVLHGDHPYFNLFESNIVQNIVIDDSHGSNGPYNTLFRNRAETFGLLMNNAPPTDSLNLVGNEINGYFIVQGSGHFAHGNSFQGNIIPPGTEVLADTTYYLEELPPFLAPIGSLPQIGPQAEAPGTIPAKLRFENGGELTICSDDDIITVVPETGGHIQVYPNPFDDRLVIEGIEVGQVRLMDLTGRIVLGKRIYGMHAVLEDLNRLPSATYLLEASDENGRTWRSVLVKQ
jgi:hypothetical protein